MFSQLGDKLQDIFKDLRGHGAISETNTNDAAAPPIAPLTSPAKKEPPRPGL